MSEQKKQFDLVMRIRHTNLTLLTNEQLSAIVGIINGDLRLEAMVEGLTKDVEPVIHRVSSRAIATEEHTRDVAGELRAKAAQDMAEACAPKQSKEESGPVVTKDKPATKYVEQKPRKRVSMPAAKKKPSR